MKRTLSTITGICLIALPLAAQNPNLGSAGAKFLQIPIGARATSMAGACVATVDDASAVFWNPAGVARVENNAAQFSSMRWLQSFDINAVSVVHAMGESGVLAASAIVLSMDRMEVTTESQPNGTGQFFDAQDLALGLTYARFLTDRFSVGITGKYVYERIWNEVADGIAFDIGTQYRIDFQNLTIAMSMTNFGGDLQFNGPDLNITYLRDKNFPNSRLAPARYEPDQYPLPLHFQVGIGMDLYRSETFSVRGAVDAAHPSDNRERINAGIETSFFDRVYLRGGYRYHYDDESFTFGTGASFPFAGSLLAFDYGYSIYDILPNVQRISVGIAF
ncbi:MAG: PorV/PorQ family protein [Ignavibacteriales bacterium]|nr:PorV/PorQ family protein [Ignavibacteriales bacterium]